MTIVELSSCSFVVEVENVIIYCLNILIPRLANRMAKMIRIESEKNPPVAVLNYVSPLYLRNEEYENRSKLRIID